MGDTEDFGAEPVAPEPNIEKKIEIPDGPDVKTSGKNLSYWLESAEPFEYEVLQEDMIADVVIIGAGIAGLSSAYALSREGKSVVVIEDGLIGSGETGRTTAHIVNCLDDRYFDIEQKHGEEGARLAAESHTKAISYIEFVVSEENIECDFVRVPGYLFLHPSDNLQNLEKEFDATRRVGLNTEWVDHVPSLSFEKGPAIKFPNQAQFHPMKYLRGLCQAITSRGGKIFTKTHASSVNPGCVELANGKKIRAEYIIVATNTPINNKVSIHSKQAAYRTYVVALKVPKGSLPLTLWWDTGDQFSKWPNFPYHYVRLNSYDETSDVLIVGGEDHKTGQPENDGMHHEDERYQRLITWAKTRFPMAGDLAYKWSGQVMEPSDDLAYIGRNPMDSPNIFIVTGDSGNGMTHGTIAAILLTDLIMGRENKWEKVYDPSRANFIASKEFYEEAGNFISQYTDLATPGDIVNEDHLKPGEGGIVRKGLNKYAVYKDVNGKINAFSALCPHLKCVVEWNNSEKTFDCPCHGSRFTCYGKVVNGPANVDLTPTDIITGQTHSKDIPDSIH